MSTFNQRLNNCINILSEFLMINSEQAKDLRKRVENEDITAYEEILKYLEELAEFKNY